MSGLSHTPGKRAWGKTHRGFESRLLRHPTKDNALMQGVFSCTMNDVFDLQLADRSTFIVDLDGELGVSASAGHCMH